MQQLYEDLIASIWPRWEVVKKGFWKRCFDRTHCCHPQNCLHFYRTGGRVLLYHLVNKARFPISVPDQVLFFSLYIAPLFIPIVLANGRKSEQSSTNRNSESLTGERPDPGNTATLRYIFCLTLATWCNNALEYTRRFTSRESRQHLTKLPFTAKRAAIESRHARCCIYNARVLLQRVFSDLFHNKNELWSCFDSF